MARSDIFRNVLRHAFRLGTVAVAGDSMNPIFLDGDWLVVRWKTACKPGDVVVIEREERPGVFLIKRLIKRVDQMIWVEGDSAASTDSRQWGAIPQEEVVGKVLFRFRRTNNSR
jgi:nickel-type superoxide dismutase maturation protease